MRRPNLLKDKTREGRHNWSQKWLSQAATVLVALVCGCGDEGSDLMKPTQLACGPGTVRSGDACVPIEAGVGALCPLTDFGGIFPG